jgi:hypothetical protein
MSFLKERRKFRFLSADNSGALVYDTAMAGPWTLEEWSLSAPEKQTNYVQIPGRDGAVDLYEGLTDGEPHYKPRTLTIRLTCSERDREARIALVDDIVNTLDGFAFRIIFPDDPTRYMRGVCTVKVEYNDLNHCGVVIEALCDPWRVAISPVVITVEASATAQSLILRNRGRRRVVPYFEGYGGASADMPEITITSGLFTATIEDAGGYAPEELALGYNRSRELTYSGTGLLLIKWEEAIL